MSQVSSATTPVVVPPELTTFIAFDFGLKRTGVAVGNRLLGTAQAQGSIHAQGEARFEQY
jgi:putative holliday junction resolvase